MKTRLLAILIVTAGITASGCTTTDSSGQSGTAKAASGTTLAQFKCADRNGNEYIDKSELIYLRQCGITEGLACGPVPENSTERPLKTDFDLGLRFVQITDADGDDRISKLEFRAHCNKAASTE